MVTAVDLMNHFLSRVASNERFTFAQVRYIGKAGTVYRSLCEKIKSGELIRNAWGVYVRATKDFVEPGPYEVAQTRAARFGHSIGETQTKVPVNSDSPYEFTTDGRSTSFIRFSGGKPCGVIKLKERSTRCKPKNGDDKCKNRPIQCADQITVPDEAACPEPKGIAISLEESQNAGSPISIVSNLSGPETVASPAFPLGWLLLLAYKGLRHFLLPAEPGIPQRRNYVDFESYTKSDVKGRW